MLWPFSYFIFDRKLILHYIKKRNKQQDIFVEHERLLNLPFSEITHNKTKLWLLVKRHDNLLNTRREAYMYNIVQ